MRAKFAPTIVATRLNKEQDQIQYICKSGLSEFKFWTMLNECPELRIGQTLKIEISTDGNVIKTLDEIVKEQEQLTNKAREIVAHSELHSVIHEEAFNSVIGANHCPSCKSCLYWGKIDCQHNPDKDDPELCMNYCPKQTEEAH